MTEAVEKQNPKPMSFSEQWHAERLLKRAKKKTRKQLQSQGYSHSQATKMVKQAVNKIASNKPERKAAGRGS